MRSGGSKTRLLQIGAVTAAVILIVALATLALSRERGSALAGRWELVLVELPTDSVEPSESSWIEFGDGRFHGVGDCVSFQGKVQVPGEGRLTIIDMSTQAECAPLSPVDTAYDDDFPAVTSYMLSSNGSLTLQSSDASVQFSYGWAP